MNSPIVADIVSSVLTLLATVFAIVVSILAQRGIAAFEKRTGIQLTDQQIAQVTASAVTAAGNIQTLLDRGKINIDAVTPISPAVIEQAGRALDRVPEAATALAKTLPSMAETIVGLIDTAPHPAKIVVSAT